MTKNDKTKEEKEFEELKRKSILTDKFINLADQLQFDDKDIPKTEKGMTTKVKELMDKLNKKIAKIPDEELEVHYLKKKRLNQDKE